MAYHDDYYEYSGVDYTISKQDHTDISNQANTEFNQFFQKKHIFDFLRETPHNGSYLIGYMDDYEFNERIQNLAEEAIPCIYYSYDNVEQAYFMEVWYGLWLDFAWNLIISPLVKLQASFRSRKSTQKFIREYNEANFTGCGF